ncbi:MAG TPA: hypothetical protein VLT81_07300, partial [Chondromyces sp.]|nr:hypothetical protein [Chondromyces sp.]
QDLERPARAALLGLTVAALLLTRPDTAPFIAGVALAGLACEWRWLRRRTFWESWVPALMLPVIVIYIPFTGWRLGYYGDLFPNTYYAKMAYLPAWERGREYLETFLRVYDLRPYLLLPLIAIPLARSGAVRRFLAGAALGSAATVLYLWRLGGDFMEWRFLMPVTGVFVPAIGIAAYLIAERLAGPALSGRGIANEGPPTAAARLVALALALAVVAWLGLSAAAGGARARRTMVAGQEHIPSLAKYAEPEHAWDEIGRACDAVLPQDLRIATTAAGMLPYFARRSTLDLHGLTCRQIARSPLSPDEVRGRLGHERVLSDRHAMRKLGAGAFVHTERLSMVPLALASVDRPDEVTVSVRIDERRYFDIDLFDPAPSLLAKLRQRDDVVFSDPSRLLPKERMVVHRELLESHRLVARLDVRLPDSEQAHEFIELLPRGRGLTRVDHEKLLGYDLPEGPLPLRDEGRRIFGTARWVVDGVSIGRDLVMVIRHDQTACSRLRVRVNGRRSTQQLALGCGHESWGEERYDIPRHLLVQGRNSISLELLPDGDAEAELYHLWFLQKSDG